mgnify:CR=1 FL=1
MKLHFNKQKQAGGFSLEAAIVMAFLGAIALVLGAIYDGEVAEAATVLDALGDASATISDAAEA